LAASRYSCIYWVDHLYDSDIDCHANQRVEFQDEGVVYTFIQKKYLYWLEALSLCRKMAEGVRAMLTLEGLVQVSCRISDATRMWF